MSNPSGRLPRLSVALPVYNGENYIEEALESVFRQTYSEFELVVSDNGSTDRTAEILARAAARDPRVRVHRSETLLPQFENMRRALDLSDTPWVKLLCHDDLMEPGCLADIAAAVPHAEAAGVGLIGHRESWLLPSGSRVRSPELTTGEPILVPGREAIVGALGGASAPLPVPSITTATVFKPAFTEAGGFDGRFVHFDIFCWLKLLTRWNYLYLPGSLTVNRIHAGQVAVQATQELRSVRDYETFIPEFLDAYAEPLKLPAALKWKARLKPATYAAKAALVGLMRGRWGEIWNAVRSCPRPLVVLMPLLVFRQYYIDRRRFSSLGGNLRFRDVYPAAG